MVTLLTEGDVDRGTPPDPVRLRAVAVLAPHLPTTHPMFATVLDWCASYDAAGVFVRRLEQARRMRDAGKLTDGELVRRGAGAGTAGGSALVRRSRADRAAPVTNTRRRGDVRRTSADVPGHDQAMEVGQAPDSAAPVEPGDHAGGRVRAVAVASGFVLWCLYGGADPRVQLDAIRTASAITVAAGGAAALLLAVRRQRSTEQTLEHERENAAEQRITEVYTRAVDQLGAEKAPVRLGALHALERLAQNNPPQRQTIVDVICSYLRMPYTPPDEHAPSEDASEDAHSRYEHRRQELRVRLTAQRILATHLKPSAAAAFWADMDVTWLKPTCTSSI